MPLDQQVFDLWSLWDSRFVQGQAIFLVYFAPLDGVCGGVHGVNQVAESPLVK
jgi:hypothetical protein